MFPDGLADKNGLWLMGDCYICFNRASSMEEIFVTKNVHFSKHKRKRDAGKPLLYNNIAHMETDNPKYKKKRKAISSSFFKNKVRQMTTIVKETALKIFKEIQDQGDRTQQDIVHVTTRL